MVTSLPLLIICSLIVLLTVGSHPFAQQTIFKLQDSFSTVTKDVPVRQIHSHNDYWRSTPLFDALRIGAQSVEADVWLLNDDEDSELYVGHNSFSLRKEKTFRNLYVNPLVKLLNEINNKSNHLSEVNADPVFRKKSYGVFDTDGYATLYLFVDIKTESLKTWKKVEKQLEPLREKNYLTSFNGSHIIYKPITVIGTGAVPVDYVQSQIKRDYFVDGPLEALGEETPSTLNPIASTNLEKFIGRPGINGLSRSQLKKIRSQIATAHILGIKTRYWGFPNWPTSTRNKIWKQLLTSGVDLLNVDDLKAAKDF